jgi:hypothetical protein
MHVPRRMLGGYHPLLIPITSGNTPAEIAGATGERSSFTMATVKPTMSSSEPAP